MIRAILLTHLPHLRLQTSHVVISHGKFLAAGTSRPREDQSHFTSASVIQSPENVATRRRSLVQLALGAYDGMPLGARSVECAEAEPRLGLNPSGWTMGNRLIRQSKAQDFDAVLKCRHARFT